MIKCAYSIKNDSTKVVVKKDLINLACILLSFFLSEDLIYKRNYRNELGNWY